MTVLAGTSGMASVLAVTQPPNSTKEQGSATALTVPPWSKINVSAHVLMVSNLTIKASASVSPAKFCWTIDNALTLARRTLQQPQKLWPTPWTWKLEYVTKLALATWVISQSMETVLRVVLTHGRLLTYWVIVSPHAKVSKLVKIASCAKPRKSSIRKQTNARNLFNHIAIP